MIRRATVVSWLAIAAMTCVMAAEAQNIKTIDKRNRSENTTYFLCFVAKPGVPGHAFVVFGQENEGRAMSTEEAWGQYPKSSKKAWMGSVPGGVVNEAMHGNSGSGYSRLIVRVNSDQYRQAKGLLARWQRKDSYQLVAQDCVTFTAEVASTIGLKVPKRSQGGLLPATFIHSLIQQN